MFEELGLTEDQKCLLIYDISKAQTTDNEHLDEHNIANVQVPPNLTHVLQPLDLNVHAFAKSFPKARFQEWYHK